MRHGLVFIPLTCGATLLIIFAGYGSPTTRGFKAQHNPQVSSAFEQSPWSFISPYDIEQYVNLHNAEADLNEIWRSFGIPIKEGKPGRCGCRGSGCPGNCKAEIVHIPDTDSGTGFVILRICYAGESDCWFLLFKKEQEWKYVDIVESMNNKYNPPQHRIAENKTCRWLVIKELWGGGTGFSQYGERWYDVSDAGLKDVLSYPVSGHNVQGDAEDYEFKSQVSGINGNGNYTVDISYTVLRDGKHGSSLQWLSSREYEVLFVWDVVSKRFELDELNSKLPKSGNDPISKYIFGKRQSSR